MITLLGSPKSLENDGHVSILSFKARLQANFPLNESTERICRLNMIEITLLFSAEFKVDGGNDPSDKTGSPNHAFDDEDEIELTSYETESETTTTSSTNRNRHPYKNKVSVESGGGVHHGSTNVGGSGGHRDGSNGHHSNNNNRGKYYNNNNYTPGGERTANSGGGGGGGGRGSSKASNDRDRTRHTKKPGSGRAGDGRHVDNPLVGPGSNNVYQTQMVPDGSSTTTSSAASIYYYNYFVSPKNNHYCNSIISNIDDKVNSIVSCNRNQSSIASMIGATFSQVQKQLLLYVHHYYYHPFPLIIGGSGFILQILQLATTRRDWLWFCLM